MSPHKAGLITGAIFASFSLVFWPIILVLELSMKSNMPKDSFPPAMRWFFLAFPVIYGIGSYLMTALMCVLFNLFSKLFGGIQLTLEKTPDVTETAAV